MLNEYELLNKLREVGKFRPEILKLHDKLLNHMVSMELAETAIKCQPQLSTFEKDYLLEDDTNDLPGANIAAGA